jgi:hypothetical protein
MLFRLASTRRVLLSRPKALVHHRHASKVAQSPRLRKAARVQNRPPASSPWIKDWPASLLDDAFKNGVLPIDTARATTFLSEFFALNGGQPTKESAQKLLEGK